MKHQKMAVRTVRIPLLRKSSTKPRGTPEEQSMRRMRRYIADGLGFKLSQLPGFEASVLALAVEAKLWRKRAKDTLRELHMIKNTRCADYARHRNGF